MLFEQEKTERTEKYDYKLKNANCKLLATDQSYGQLGRMLCYLCFLLFKN
jgi:hypothetical protein